MNKTLFTPGPWEAGKNPCMTTILDGYEGKTVYPKESNHHIAWANAENSDGDLDIETALANAALIAAAPEMYEALKTACSIMQDGLVCMKTCKGCPIGKSLRKARGESEVKE